jgi:hypothetical protein
VKASAAHAERRLRARLHQGPLSHQVIELAATEQLGMPAAGRIRLAVVRPQQRPGFWQVTPVRGVPGSVKPRSVRDGGLDLDLTTQLSSQSLVDRRATYRLTDGGRPGLPAARRADEHQVLPRRPPDH